MSKFQKKNEDHVDEAFNRFADLMIEHIASIQEDWKKPWFSNSLPVPRNVYDGKGYDALNALMLSLHCEKNGYKIPVFGTYNRFLSFNFKTDADGTQHQLLDEQGNPLPRLTVNKGEKGFPLYYTSYTAVDKETKEKIKWDDFIKMSDEDKRKYNVYPKRNVWPVFCIEQTNMKEARPELYAKFEAEVTPVRPARNVDEMFSFPVMDKMLESQLWFCPIHTREQDGAYYSPGKDEIYLPLKSQFEDGESFYGTALHEMTHSTGSENRLNRLKPITAWGDNDYAREELVAELGAAFECHRHGIEKCMKKDSAAYLKSWLSSLKQSPEYIRTVLTDVKSASSMIDRRLAEVEKSLEQEAAVKADEKSEQQIGQTPARNEDISETVPAKAATEKTRIFDSFNIPVYAVPYFATGETDGLADEDLKNIRDFEKSLPVPHIMNFPDDLEAAQTFVVSPAFGRATDCIKMDVLEVIHDLSEDTSQKDGINQAKESAYERYDEYACELCSKYGPEYYDSPDALEKLLTPDERAEWERRLSAYMAFVPKSAPSEQQHQEQQRSQSTEEEQQSHRGMGR